MVGTDLNLKLPNRPDIDGLRAISVLVFLYHLEVPLFGGGFVARHLLRDLGLPDLAHRADRCRSAAASLWPAFTNEGSGGCFPPAFVTIIGTLLIGAFWFSPEHFKSLAQDVVATLGSVSNFYFWRGSHDYFAKAIDPSAVLHFWSLAVEEQFYLVWPAVLLICWRFLGKALPVLILLIGAASLSAAQARLAIDPAGAFYLPIYRAYEFAIGALVIFAERRVVVSTATQSLLAVLGFGLITYAVISFDGMTAFPGVNALIPCIGAACLIWAGRPTRSRQC